MKIFVHTRLLAFSVIAIAAASSPAHEIDRNQLGLRVGGSDCHLLDQHASPLIYSSLGLASNISYVHGGEEDSHSLDGAFFFNDLTTTSDNYHTRNWRAGARYTYLRSVTEFNLFQRIVKLSLGGSLTSFFSKTDYYYQFGSIDARAIASWYWSHSIDLAAHIQYTLAPREFFSGRLSLPLISNVARPPYSPSGNYSYVENDWKIRPFGDTRLLPANLFVDFSMAYQRPLAGNFNIEVRYEFASSSYDRPADMNMYANNLCAGVFFCF